MDNIKWEGNSKAMFDFVLNEIVPKMMKKPAMKKAEKFVADNNITVVTEDMMLKAAREKAPAKYKNKIMTKFDELKSN